MYTLYIVMNFLIKEDVPMVRLTLQILDIIIFMMWSIMRCRKKVHAPKLVFIYALAYMIIGNL